MSVCSFTTPVSEELNVKWWNCLMLAILLKFMSLNFFCQLYVCTWVSSLSLSTNCTWFILVTGQLCTMHRHISDTEHIWLLWNLAFNTPNPASGANFIVAATSFVRLWSCMYILMHCQLKDKIVVSILHGNSLFISRCSLLISVSANHGSVAEPLVSGPPWVWHATNAFLLLT